MVLAIWDDDYGISVPKEYHTTGGSISDFLTGIRRKKNKAGYEILKVKGWDYEGLLKAFEKAARVAREAHVPVLIHVEEMTQPQGHSTSGSHERYKSEGRLAWEKKYDCITQFRAWILDNLACEEEIESIEKEAKATVKSARTAAWEAFMNDIKADREHAVQFMEALAAESELSEPIVQAISELRKIRNPIRLDTIRTVKQVLRITKNEKTSSRVHLLSWLKQAEVTNAQRYNSHVMSVSSEASAKVTEVKAEYSASSPLVDGREVLQACFDAALSRDPRIFAIGEDVGKIGDVNQAFAGLQAKYGTLRVTDTGIRETTIIGQGIGAALRGLRPIAEIQYLDYLLYAIQTLSDDLATLQYRTAGGQKAPLIIRTRGHRLEGIWHSGSPIGMIINSLRGINILVPRNMTQAAGFYNTMLKSDDPGLIIECLNGYRLKEKIPDNIGAFTVPLGQPEVLRQGTDVTVVTYGAMCRIVMQAALELEETGISTEVIDVQTLLPFDVDHSIIKSLKKTNRVVFADEDVPGGASAYMMQKIVEEQGGYSYLDSPPVTIAAKEHRPAYASDGDYFSKPNVETTFDKIYALMNEAEPDRFPPLY